MTGRRKGTPCACETDPCSCGSSKGKCIRTINNLSPDPNGDFFIEAGSGITITQTGDNSFEVSFDGTFPSNPLIYKGTVGSGGTVAVLPAADPDNIGWCYIAIETATSPVTYEVGDVLISDGYTWQVVPSGDEIVPIVTAWQATPDDQHVPSEKLVKDSLDAKLDKITTGANPRVYAHTGGYQHDIQCASAASTGTVMLRDANARAYGDDPADDNDLLCLVNVNTLKTKLNDVVYKTTAQTITATKTFTAVQVFRKDDDNIILSNPNFTVGTLPTSDKYNSILFRGAGITNIGWITQGYHIDGSGTIALRTYTYDQNSNAEFQIHVNSSQAWMSGPNRTYNASNTTDIVNIALLDAYTPMVRTTGNQTIAGDKLFTKPIEAAMGGWHPTYTTSSDIGEITLFAKLKDEAIGKYIELEFMQSSNTATIYGILGIANVSSATGFWFIRRGTGSNNPLQVDSIVIAKDGNGVQYLGCRRKVTYGAMRTRVIKSYNYGVLYDTPSPLIEWLNTGVPIGTGTGYTITEMTE